MNDLHIHFARGCAIVAALLVVYLIACGINALISHFFPDHDNND